MNCALREAYQQHYHNSDETTYTGSTGLGTFGNVTVTLYGIKGNDYTTLLTKTYTTSASQLDGWTSNIPRSASTSYSYYVTAADMTKYDFLEFRYSGSVVGSTGSYSGDHGHNSTYSYQSSYSASCYTEKVTAVKPTVSISPANGGTVYYSRNTALSLTCPSPTVTGVPAPSVSYSWTGTGVSNATSRTCSVAGTSNINGYKNGIYTCTVTATNNAGSATATYKVTLQPNVSTFTPSFLSGSLTTVNFRAKCPKPA